MAKKSFLIGFSLVVAMALTVLPLPMWMLWLKPNWVLLVLIFWAIYQPQKVGVGVFFITGLLLDLLDGSVLGVHAFAFVLVGYVIVKLHRRLIHFPLRQQVVVMAGFLLGYKLIVFIVQACLHQAPNSILYWLSIVVSLFFWPWIKALLGSWQRQWQHH